MTLVVQHQFLLQEGEWELGGLLYTQSNAYVLLSGQVTIQHLKDVWILTNNIELQYEQGIERSSSEYHIQPFSNLNTSSMRVKHPEGDLTGQICYLTDCFMLDFNNADQSREVMEVKWLQPDGRYECRGHMLQKKTLLTRWATYIRPLKIAS